jgi:hypothetical protein
MGCTLGAISGSAEVDLQLHPFIIHPIQFSFNRDDGSQKGKEFFGIKW